MRDPHAIPATLDEPMRFALLTVDEAVIFFTPFFVLGFLCNALMTGFVIGSLGVIVLKKLKGEHGHCYALHCLYWYYPRLLKLRYTPPSSQRHYVG